MSKLPTSEETAPCPKNLKMFSRAVGEHSEVERWVNAHPEAWFPQPVFVGRWPEMYRIFYWAEKDLY